MQQLSQSNMLEIVKKLNIKNKEKGSLTVEAAMIFPLIMFIMFAIIYLTIIHYQNNVMIAESIRAMNRAGAYYQYIDMDGYGNYGKPENSGLVNSLPFDSDVPAEGIIDIDMIKNRNVYRTVVDIFAESNIVGETVAKISSIFFNVPIGAKRENARRYVNARVSGVKFKQYIENEKEIDQVEDKSFMFLAGVLSAKYGRQYINPLQGLSRMYLGDNGIMENIKSKDIETQSIISNQSEFIRNLDTVYDIGLSLFKEFKLHKGS